MTPGPDDAAPRSPGDRPEPAQVAAPPGGALLAAAKHAFEWGLWTRVALQRRLEARRGRARRVPASVPPTAVLQDATEWARAVREARALRLPPHRDKQKNWDALGAVAAVMTLADDGSRTASVLDAGSARYSPVLPWLRLYGLGDGPSRLVGINLEFGAPVRRDGVLFRAGDATSTGFADASFDAVTCMSVIEHGVPLRPFLAECARVVRPGGIVVVSTDYDQEPPDTTGVTAYGTPVHIFSPAEITEFVADAAACGLVLVGDLEAPGALTHPTRPVHWKRTGLDYTFILLTFRRQ